MSTRSLPFHVTLLPSIVALYQPSHSSSFLTSLHFIKLKNSCFPLGCGVFMNMLSRVLRLVMPMLCALSHGLLQYTDTISFLSSRAPDYMKHLYKTCLADEKGGLASVSLCVPELPSMNIPEQSGSLVSLEHININVGSCIPSLMCMCNVPVANDVKVA